MFILDLKSLLKYLLFILLILKLHSEIQKKKKKLFYCMCVLRGHVLTSDFDVKLKIFQRSTSSLVQYLNNKYNLKTSFSPQYFANIILALLKQSNIIVIQEIFNFNIILSYNVFSQSDIFSKDQIIVASIINFLYLTEFPLHSTHSVMSSA